MEWIAFEQTGFSAPSCVCTRRCSTPTFVGNEADSKREIRVGCSLAPGRVEMDVEDEGKGYDAHPVLEFSAEGRPPWPGDCIDSQFMNSVAIQGDGKRIVMSLNKE